MRAVGWGDIISSPHALYPFFVFRNATHSARSRKGPSVFLPLFPAKFLFSFYLGPLGRGGTNNKRLRRRRRSLCRRGRRDRVGGSRQKPKQRRRRRRRRRRLSTASLLISRGKERKFEGLQRRGRKEGRGEGKKGGRPPFKEEKLLLLHYCALLLRFSFGLRFWAVVEKKGGRAG